MSEHTSPQAPEPFDPRSAKEVAARFNEAVAADWFAATTDRRKAMIKQLLALEEHQKRRAEEDAANRVIPIDDNGLDESAEDARRAARRAKTYTFPGGEQSKRMLEANRDRYLAEITMKLGLSKDHDSPQYGRLREDIATRALQVHMIDLLLGGRLAYDELTARVQSDPHCTGLSQIGMEYEYDALLDRLIIKRFVREEPSAPTS